MTGKAPPKNDERPSAERRADARKIFEHALREASIDRAFARHVHCERGVLRICEDLYDLNSFGRVFVVVIGKAAHGMAQALVAQAGERFEGIVASSTAPASQLRGFRYFQSGHPVPNADSVRAAEAALKSLDAQTAASLVIYLLSGGGSAMMEKAIDDDIPLADLIATYKGLVHSSAPIAEINAIRKHLSAVKGGRMAQAAYPAQQVSLLVSDVPDHTPDALASGPSMADSTSVEDCYSIASRHGLLESFPASVRELFERRALEETPKSDDPAFIRSRWWTVSSNASLLDAARATAEELSFAVTVDNSCDDWEYSRAADYLLAKVRDLRKVAGPVCLLSGGEVTVKVDKAGTGGRNQEFVIDCAEKIAGEKITVLSAGSDGIDGNSSFAGAVADGTTLARAQALGLSAEAHRVGFNASPFFAALGDALNTGPTGSNLRDLRILLAY